MEKSVEFVDNEHHKEGREEDGLVKDWADIVHVLIRLMWMCFCQGRTLAGVDSDPEETSEVEEEQDFPTIGSESESSTYGLTKKKKKSFKEKKEKNSRRKRNEEEDEDEDEEEDGTMKVSLG